MAVMNVVDVGGQVQNILLKGFARRDNIRLLTSREHVGQNRLSQ